MAPRVLAAALILAVTSSQILAPVRALAQSNARTACLNQWLFNGVWRAKVTKVEPIMDGSQQTGWRVTQTWRNGTSRELAPADSSLKTMDLQLSSSTLPAEGHNIQQLVFNGMAPSGELTYSQAFYGPNMRVDPNDKPKSLDVTFDNAAVSTSNKPHFSSKQYNFHYNLGCVASGASAQAQGGSSQIAATNGCMNQWMSNGVWKMRVLAVTPNPPGTAAKDQNGWQIKQEWVNITHGTVFIGGFNDGTRHIAPTNVSDEFLATKSGNNASSSNVAGGFAFGEATKPFPPGVPRTFEQLIAGGNLDPADAPTRLLVTFNTDMQRQMKKTWAYSYALPQYRMPANFRVSLLCGGTVTMAPGWETLHTPSPSQPAAPSQTAAGSQNAAPAQQVATAPKQQSGSALSSDPCAMLSQNDVASALGVGVRSVGTAQHPSPNECSWAVASHAGAPAQNVVLIVQNVSSKPTCRGFSCLHMVQAVLGPAVPSLPGPIADAFTGAELISGLGDKAAWKDGRLTVVKADIAFQLLVHSPSPALATSEALARDVLYHVAP